MIRKKTFIGFTCLLFIFLQVLYISLDYKQKMDTVLTKQELIREIIVENKSESVKVKFIPSNMETKENGIKKYVYTTEYLEDDNKNKIKSFVVFNLEDKLSDTELLRTYTGKVYYISIRIPKKVISNEEMKRYYSSNTIIKNINGKKQYYFVILYKTTVKINSKEYTYKENKTEKIAKKLKSQKTKNLIKLKAYNQYKNTNKNMIKEKTKSKIKYFSLLDIALVVFAMVLNLLHPLRR